MGKLDAVFKSEAARLARKEIRPLVNPLRRQVRALSKQVKFLVSENRKLTGALGRLQRVQASPGAELVVPAAELGKTRISGRLIKKLRGKHGLTQSQLASLIGVSPAAVQSWEQGIARPGAENKAALVALRKSKKADVAALLAKKGIGKPGRKPRIGAPKAKPARPAAKAKPARKRRPKRRG